jgi:hypothetical protein
MLRVKLAPVVLALIACACAQPPRSAPQVRECALRLEDPLATRVNTSPGPYAVYVIFREAPTRWAWNWMGFVDCGADQACVGQVERYKLLRLCNDGNVRSIEAWD